MKIIVFILCFYTFAAIAFDDPTIKITTSRAAIDYGYFKIYESSKISYFRTERGPARLGDLVRLCFQLKLDADGETKVLEDCGDDYKQKPKVNFFNSIVEIARNKGFMVAVNLSPTFSIMNDYDIAIIAPSIEAGETLEAELEKEGKNAYFSR
ncbi:MAG: hypothetical protein A2381_14725 [Bdellovibrionales bacterium RIFOXYB1_FULL_37_110]|nr:MAG: hypothetical protein A2417_10230 [Bdellovibrionales bacterium RIFOXYC1_FULL_37_79]OFZ60119.1 MAG: hypothetical protein A2381_14725 [Bdellovibrionales bacterium RIFOXYB1_FULL_37_110]OFZ64387.1 MAG: hypothetical protein A2577_10045 [Bdellovibrionales bacterium RIFOXYD1_FULL_36_51]